MLTDRAESMAEQLQAHRQEFPGTGSATTSGTRARSWLPEFAHAVLLVTGVGFALFTTFAWRSGLSNLPALKLYLLLPLLGGLLALARLTTAQLRRPGRETLTYLLFGVALLSWGLSGFWHVFAASQARGVVAFPSLGDFGYVGGGLMWGAGIWILYEGEVKDFLAEVEANSFLLSAMALITVFVLSVAGGSDLVEAIKAGGNTLQIVALAYPLIYGFNVVMLMRFVHARRGTQDPGGRQPLMIIVGGLLLLYLAQMGWSTTVIIDQRLAGEPVVIPRVTATQVLFTLAYLVLALGVTSYRLPAAPSISREDDPRKKASSPYGGHPVP